MLYAVTTEASTKNTCTNLNMPGGAQHSGINSIRINLLQSDNNRADEEM